MGDAAALHQITFCVPGQLQRLIRWNLTGDRRPVPMPGFIKVFQIAIIPQIVAAFYLFFKLCRCTGQGGCDAFQLDE
jgi:hypothetical protein